MIIIDDKLQGSVRTQPAKRRKTLGQRGALLVFILNDLWLLLILF